MINSAGIPRIPGDIQVLAEHARELQRVGAEIADTGESVHSTWQGLAPVYDTPEAGQLLAATGPVMSVSAAMGEDVTATGTILGTYAREVEEIQRQLDSLRAQAGDFEQSVDGDDSWREDGDKVERSNQLVGQVNAAWAAFQAAESKCVNALNALYGSGQPCLAVDYTAEQLDQAAASDQGLPWGRSTEEEPGLFSSIGHGILDVGGLVPGFGEPLDGINALWYLAEGDKLNAGLSAAGMVPFAGWGATGGKLINKGVRSVDNAPTGGGARSGDVPPGSSRSGGPGGAEPPPRKFVTTPRGTTFQVPGSWPSRPADNGRGIVYQRPGATGNRDSIRIMEPTPDYPNGYYVYYDHSNQPLDVNGKPGSKDATHISEDYKGVIKSWPE
ncbi:MAG: hypothetical protein GEU83_01275 [Pseudonocardiaceae bacterium]|nr:hypothetical protein [Pseudonocardiaceae bacterium]